MTKPILCSEIISGLSQPKRAIALYQGGSIADAKIREKQLELINAKKFVITNSIVEKAYEISTQKPSVMLEMLDNLHMPFDNVWIEWDELARQEYVKKYWEGKPDREYPSDINDYPDKLGYHIKNFTDPIGDNYNLYESWYFIDERTKKDPRKEFDADAFNKAFINKFYTTSMCAVIRNHTPSFKDEMAKQMQLKEFPQEWLNEMSESAMKIKSLGVGSKLLSGWYLMQFMPPKFFKKFNVETADRNNLQIDMNRARDLIAYENNHEWNCYKEICYRISPAQSSAMHWQIPKGHFEKGYSKDEMTFHEEQWMTSCEGDARFLISLFSIINQNLHEQRVVQPDSKIVHTKLGRRVPRNEYKVLDINLSNNQVRKVIRSKFVGKGNPKRQHDRRGHFRHFRDENGSVVKKTWVKDCVVGKKELGIVQKDYNLK